MTDPAYPSINDTRGTNFPDEWHPGITKAEYFLGLALQGALASGKGAEDAAITAQESVEALSELMKPEKKGATRVQSEAKSSGDSKQGGAKAYR